MQLSGTVHLIGSHQAVSRRDYNVTQVSAPKRVTARENHEPPLGAKGSCQRTRPFSAKGRSCRGCYDDKV